MTWSTGYEDESEDNKRKRMRSLDLAKRTVSKLFVGGSVA